MPRNVNPGDLKTGSGKRVPEKGTTVVLTGGGMAGPGPNIGQAGWVSPSGTVPLPRWVRAKLSEGAAAGEAVHAHIDTAKGAHPATAISLDGHPETLHSDNVEGAFDEVVGVFPPQPPMLGGWAPWTTFSGIPDWGALKTDDAGLKARGIITSTVGDQDDANIYPYYHKVPSPLITDINDSPFGDAADPGGRDPQTDPLWNSNVNVGVTSMYGAGVGLFFASGYTRPGTAANDPVIRSTLASFRSSTLDDVTALPLRTEVTLSGSIYPADRGVLALIHWPPGQRENPPTVQEFLAQPLLDRVVAAILLGQGILGEGCDGGDDDCDNFGACDGDPGGIFSIGQDADGNYDPFAFPGRATGQYNLSEIHRGLDALDAQGLKAPFDGGAGVYDRDLNATTPALGQVRLGTDPNAGEADPSGYGIPILGGDVNAYDPDPVAVANVAAPRIGHTVIGNAIISMESPTAPGFRLLTQNFFGYRLPYLKDYSAEGLKWTPSGADPVTTREKFRFFQVAQPADPAFASVNTAGNYGTPFDEDYVTWQVGRYRQAFLMPSTEVNGVEEEVGSYWLIHFKKERDFEAFVRDGVMPWDATDGYEIYGAQTIDTTDPVEGSANLVNEVSSGGTFTAPDGPAADYGYVARTYFQRRSNILLDYIAAPTFTGTFDWLRRVGSPDGVMYVSGVAYFVSHRQDTGANNVLFSGLDITETTNGFFDRLYRTDDAWLNSENVVAGTDDPALLSTPSPAFITFFPFAFGPHPAPPADQPDGPSATFPLNADTDLGLSDPLSPKNPSRVEVPFTHMGPGGANQYSDANGPQIGDAAVIGMAGGADITFHGDASQPAFTMRARPRAFFRTPLGHQAATTAVIPYSANDGHGIIVEPSDGAVILLHTTSFDPINFLGEFGNFTSGATPSSVDPNMFTFEKDVWERFLDESYRYITSFHRGLADPDGLHAIAGYGSIARRALTGPGLFTWGVTPIEVPVRAGATASHSTDWANTAWLPMNIHQQEFNLHGGGGLDAITPELQVVGWPDRNPPITDMVNAPFPSTGLLIYPKTDYSPVGSPNLRPNLAQDALPADQPDYSSLAGLRTFVRAFDASFGQAVAAAGQPFFTIRLDGIQLSDFAYDPPGPGGAGVAKDKVAVLVKVPGLTTWMDLGRADGAGPSKQDPNLDGAGCMVVGPDTFDAVDPVTGIVYCQVRVNVGPAVNLFASTGIEGTTVGEVPVLVKVQMGSPATPYAMDNEYDPGTDTFLGPVPGPGISYERLRGICGIRLVQPV